MQSLVSTTGLNEAVALIGQFQKEFEHKKAERLSISDKTFGNVPRVGLEPTPCCQEQILSLSRLPISPPRQGQETAILNKMTIFGQRFLTRIYTQLCTMGKCLPTEKAF